MNYCMEGVGEKQFMKPIIKFRILQTTTWVLFFLLVALILTKTIGVRMVQNTIEERNNFFYNKLKESKQNISEHKYNPNGTAGDRFWYKHLVINKKFPSYAEYRGFYDRIEKHDYSVPFPFLIKDNYDGVVCGWKEYYAWFIFDVWMFKRDLIWIS